MTWLERLKISRFLAFLFLLELALLPAEASPRAGQKGKSSDSAAAAGKDDKDIVRLIAPARRDFKRLKRRLAVIDFENKSNFTGADVGRGLTDMLITALAKSGRFIIIERDELEAVLREEAYAQTSIFDGAASEKIEELQDTENLTNIGIAGYLTPGAFIRIGDILKVDAIATGGIAEFGPSQVAGWTVTTRFRVGLDIHLVDAKRGKILVAEHISKVSDKRLDRTALEGIDFHTSEFLQGVIGLTAREVVDTLVEKTIKAMASRPWEGAIMKIEGAYLSPLYEGGGRPRKMSAIKKDIMEQNGVTQEDINKWTWNAVYAYETAAKLSSNECKYFKLSDIEKIIDMLLQISVMEETLSGDYERIIAVLSKQLRSNPDSPNLYSCLGHYCTALWGKDSNKDHLNKAIEHYSKSVELAPDQFRTHMNLVTLYFIKYHLGEKDSLAKAKEEYNWVQANDNSPEGYWKKGLDADLILAGFKVKLLKK